MTVNRVIRRSIEFALENPSSSHDFVSENAKEMDGDVVRNHIKLYVNEYSVYLGQTGRRALTELYRIAADKGLVREMPADLFLD